MRIHITTPLVLTAVFAILLVGFRVMLKNEVLKLLLPIADFILFIVAIILQFRWAEKEEMYYITHLKLSPDTVEIFYTKKDEPFAITGPPADFIFEKKIALGRTGSTYQQSYLEIYHKRQLLIRQYTSDEWTDMKFIQIVHAGKD
jgi:hypothetical protein